MTAPQTPAPAAPDLPIPQPGRAQPPAGRASDSTAPAGFQGDEFRRQVKAAQAEWNAALIRRKTGRHRGSSGRYRAGMARRPPDDAA